MAVIDVTPYLKGNNENTLLSKKRIDKVNGTKKREPEAITSGSQNLGYSEQRIPGLPLDNSSLAKVPNIRKDIGSPMLDEGFIKLPRSLLRSEGWKSLRMRQQALFLYILSEAQHKPYVFKYNGKDIHLNRGELCISLRRLVIDFNRNIKFKEEMIDLPFVQRAVSAFSERAITDTRTDTGITIIKIIFPGIYDEINSETDTTSDTRTIQERYTNEERKNVKNIEETIDRADAPDSSLSFERKNEEEGKPSVFTAESSQRVKAGNVLDPEKQKHFDALWKIAVQKGVAHGHTKNHKPGVKEQDLIGWLKIHDGKEIFECMKLAEGKDIQKSYGAYITKLLRDKIPKREKDLSQGKILVESFIKDHKLKHIDMKKDYFKDLISDEQSYYHLPTQTLTAILNRSLERAKEREEEDKRQAEEDDRDY